MALIDFHYFETGIIRIGQLEQAAVQETVTDCINNHEPEFMDAALGVGFYEAFLTGLAVTPTPEQRWTDLKVGKIFVDSLGKQQRWVGFAPSDKTKVCATAAYIYWYYVRENMIQTGGIGFVQSQPENGSTVNPLQKQSYAWNEMFKQVYVLWEYLYVNREIYPEFDSQYTDEGFFGSHLQNTFGI